MYLHENLNTNLMNKSFDKIDCGTRFDTKIFNYLLKFRM